MSRLRSAIQRWLRIRVARVLVRLSETFLKAALRVAPWLEDQ